MITYLTPYVTITGFPRRMSTIGIRYADVPLPDEGRMMRAFPGVGWIRMPIPIPLQHVNLWVLGDRDGVILVDTGMNDDLCRDVWEEIAGDVEAIGPVKALLCTHWHPDHFGLAATLQSRFRVPMWMHPSDQSACAEFWETPGATWAARNRAFYATHGFDPPTEFDGVLSLAEYRSGIEGLPVDARPLLPGMSFEAAGQHWEAILVQGHTQGHVCLHCRSSGMLISGDQLLPTISTNISVSLMQNGDDPLSQYLDSLTRLGRLPQDTLVLPAHGRPFFDPGQRTEALWAHHRAKLAVTAEACRAPSTAAQVAPLLFRRTLEGMSMVLALGETIAHLRRLVTEGRLTEAVDEEGLHRFASL